MPTEQILALLLAERDKLNRAIEALQGPAKRRGRPPGNPATATVVPNGTSPARKKRHFSAAQREAAAERMRQRWAAKKKVDSKAANKTKRAAKAA